MDNWRLRHIGIIVKDIKASVSYYESIGGVPLGDEFQLKGYDDHALRAQFLNCGPVELELIQPLGDSGMQVEYLARHGEGAQHLAFTVDDLAAERAKLEAKGVKLIFEKDFPDGTRMAYFDTGKVADIMIELVQPSAGQVES